MDGGSANVTYPLARECLKQGLEVVVITEGRASGIYEEAKVPLYFKGTFDFQEEPYTLDASAVLRKVKPDFVIVGLGGPIHLEHTFGLAANQAGIPLVKSTDFWNGVIRSSAEADAVFAIDEFDARLSQNMHPSAKVFIHGNPGVPKDPIIPAPEAVDLKKRFDRVYTYIGGAENSGYELEFLRKCFALTPGNWCLIPRFHPKYAVLKPPGGTDTYDAIWRKMLEPMGDRVVYLDAIKTGDRIVVASDVNLSAWGTLLTTSAHARKVSICLWIPSAKKELKEVAALDEVPMVALGCAHSISQPRDLSVFGLCPEENLAKLKPYDPVVAFGFLRQLLGSD